MWTIPDGEPRSPSHFSLSHGRGDGEGGPGLHYRVCCYLLDTEFHLEEILRARDAKDCARIARNARLLAGIAVQVGARRTAAAARRLYEACRRGDRRRALRLVGVLHRDCRDSDLELRSILEGFQDRHAPAFRRLTDAG
jgi:hypothetical protein